MKSLIFCQSVTYNHPLCRLHCPIYRLSWHFRNNHYSLGFLFSRRHRMSYCSLTIRPTMRILEGLNIFIVRGHFVIETERDGSIILNQLLTVTLITVSIFWFIIRRNIVTICSTTSTSWFISVATRRTTGWPGTPCGEFCRALYEFWVFFDDFSNKQYFHWFLHNLQSPSLQVPVSDLSSELTSSQ